MAKDIDGFEGRGETWHADLLTQVAVDVPRLRPPALSSEQQRRLREYLRFRHLFRNLYLFDLEPAQVVRLLRGLEPLWADLRPALRGFAGALRGLAEGTRTD